MGDAGDKVPTEQMGDEPLPLTISNERAHTELGWQPRPLDETVADTLTSLRTLGAL